MQYTVYQNNGNSRDYPFLLEIQSDIIDDLNTRLAIPLYPLTGLRSQAPLRLTPLLEINGEPYLLLTHAMASVRKSQLGAEVCSVEQYRYQIKSALDFLLDGF